MTAENVFIGVDYGLLESSTLMTLFKQGKVVTAGTPGPSPGPTHWDTISYAASDARESQRFTQKMMNLGLAYGAANTTKLCPRCGRKVGNLGPHDRKECRFFLAQRRYEKVGYIPIRPDLKKLFEAAGVRVHKGRRRLFPTQLHLMNPKPKQMGYYAPVWAALLYEQSKVGSLTALHRPKVRQLLSDLRYALANRKERVAIAGEEVLRGGVCARACQAILDRSTR